MPKSYDQAELAAMFLPVGEMLQLARVVRIEEETIVGEQPIAESDWIFRLHFPGDPIFPGSLLIEGAGQVIAVWAWNSGLHGKPRLVKVAAEFKSPVVPADRLITYVGTVHRRRNVCRGEVAIRIGEREVGTVSGSLIVLEG